MHDKWKAFQPVLDAGLNIFLFATYISSFN